MKKNKTLLLIAVIFLAVVLAAELGIFLSVNSKKKSSGESAQGVVVVKDNKLTEPEVETEDSATKAAANIEQLKEPEDKQENPIDTKKVENAVDVTGNTTADGTVKKEEKTPSEKSEASTKEEEKTVDVEVTDKDDAAASKDDSSKEKVVAKVKWVIKPEFEAEDVFYPVADRAGFPEDDYTIIQNEMKNQFMSQYVFVKDGDKYDLMDLNGDLLTDYNITSYNLTTGDSFAFNLDTPMKSEELTQPSYPNQDFSYVEFNVESSSFSDGIRDTGFYSDFHYIYKGELHDYLENSYSDLERMEPSEPIGVQESSKLLKEGEAESFVEKQLKGKYAIWADGELKTDFIYDECGSYEGGLLAVKMDDKWGYVDEEGKEVIPCEYDASWENYYDPIRSTASDKEYKDFCYSASGGYVTLVKDGEWELRTTKGKLAIAPGKYDKILPVYKGKCWVEQDGRWGLISVKKKTSKKKTAVTPEPTETPAVEETPTNPSDEIYTQIAGRKFIFTSGVGSWGTEVIVNSDGSFSGSYEDADFDYTYFCDFIGQFTDAEKLEENRYSVRKESLTITSADSASTEPYGMEGSDYFEILCPGYPTAAIDAETLSWLRMTVYCNMPSELDRYCLINTGQKYMFYS